MGNKPANVKYDCKNFVITVKEFINNQNDQLRAPVITVEKGKQIENSNFLEKAYSDDFICLSLEIINKIFSQSINKENNTTFYNSICVYSGIDDHIQNQSMFIINNNLNLLSKKYENMNCNDNGLFHKLDDLSSIKAKSHLKISMTDYDKTSIVKDKDTSLKMNIINSTLERKEIQPKVRTVLKKIVNKNEQKKGSIFLKRQMNYRSPNNIRKFDDFEYKSDFNSNKNIKNHINSDFFSLDLISSKKSFKNESSNKYYLYESTKKSKGKKKYLSKIRIDIRNLDSEDNSINLGENKKDIIRNKMIHVVKSVRIYNSIGFNKKHIKQSGLIKRQSVKS